MERNDALRRKLSGQDGLTLLELLVTILLIGLVGGVITATVDLAARQFHARTQDADAQLLCSALSLFVQNELTYAGDVKTDASGNVTGFTDHARGLGAGCSFTTLANGRLAVQSGGSSYEPVGSGAYGGERSRKALTEAHTIRFADDVATVTIEVRAEGESRVLASSTFLVRPIAPGAVS